MRVFETIEDSDFNKLFFINPKNEYEFKFICYAFEDEDNKVLRQDNSNIIGETYAWINETQITPKEDYMLFFFFGGMALCFKKREIAMNFLLRFG